MHALVGDLLRLELGAHPPRDAVEAVHAVDELGRQAGQQPRVAGPIRGKVGRLDTALPEGSHIGARRRRPAQQPVQVRTGVQLLVAAVEPQQPEVQVMVAERVDGRPDPPLLKPAGGVVDATPARQSGGRSSSRLAASVGRMPEYRRYANCIATETR
jgi:hypothetical protein